MTEKFGEAGFEMTTEFEWDFFPQTPHTGQTGQALPSVVEILR
ncbi:MAG: hypothetical protein ACYC6P_12730 [Ignavibacteriaceae bacterium]